MDKREIDIFIPSKNIGIEYNGYFSHKEKAEKDAAKKKYFHSIGIFLLVVKEYKTEGEKENADYYIHERTAFNDLTHLIEDILVDLKVEVLVDVDCERDAKFTFLFSNNTIPQKFSFFNTILQILRRQISLPPFLI